ncbi:MAG: NAD(P)/FAD-dependent oxidoreductase [Deltaproteobacteria bacterium]|nr:NAD(P)/FAD-dependent oxidoreductase [Deltaproteobacteria bacterium]
MTKMDRPHIVIIGGGFGGLQAAHSLKYAEADITLIDKNNHHLFQPLLYQVATASLSPADIAAPIRWILRKQKNTKVVLGEILEIDRNKNRLRLHDREMSYDYLILATGMTHSYYGNNQWAKFAPGLKSLSESTEIRRRVLLAFETAEKCTNKLFRQSITTFVVIGGGPTGVEMAGAIAELTRLSMKEDFRNIDTGKVTVILVEAGPRLLPAMSEKSSQKAKQSLEKLGIQVRLSSPVDDIQETFVKTGDEQIKTRNVIWAAGLSASPLTENLGVDLDRAGRVKVNPELTVPGYENISVIGDLAHIQQANGSLVPGMSPAAIQEGRWAAKNIIRKMAYKNTLPFEYSDKGCMATIGKAAAVADIGPFQFSGVLAWIIWLSTHIFFLIGFRNRLVVIFQWAWAYFTTQRHSRLITHPWHFWEPGIPDKQISRMPGCYCEISKDGSDCFKK